MKSGWVYLWDRENIHDSTLAAAGVVEGVFSAAEVFVGIVEVSFSTVGIAVAAEEAIVSVAAFVALTPKTPS